MADSKTAAEWQSVLNQANSQKTAAQTEAQSAFMAAFQANANVAAAKAAVDVEVAANGGKLPFFSTAYKDYKNAVAQADIKNAANETAQANLANINATVKQAETSLATAQSSAPGVTNATTDPASANPGNPDSVQVTNPAQKVANNETSTVVEGVTVGGPIAASNATVTQTPLDDGSDPYTSNGQSTIASPNQILVNPQEVSPNEDPFEAARLAAEQRGNESPTEQAVIDAGQDAQLSQEEQGQLREFQENQRAIANAQANQTNNPQSNWTAGSVSQVRPAQTVSIQRNSILKTDWRVRLSLAKNASYLYNVASNAELLFPLKATDGIIFPYTPTIQTSYRANYEPQEFTHSNYKMYFYKNSNVDEITLTADFTAQDNYEANYLLAVIHFLKTVSKMFYGQDVNPKAGTPPPLLYLNGYGAYQFNEHPCLLSNFTYSLPNDVDYIRAGPITQTAGTNVGDTESTRKSTGFVDNIMSYIRKSASGLKGQRGKMSEEPNWTNYANTEATYVPTKMQIQLSLLPVVTRNDISKNFSIQKYATGELVRGNKRPSGGGIW